MIYLQYRNLNVAFDDNDEFAETIKKYDTLCAKLDKLFDPLHLKSSESKFNKSFFYSFTRLNDFNNLLLYIGIDNQNNPYLFLGNAKTKDVDDKIPNELFLSLFGVVGLIERSYEYERI